MPENKFMLIKIGRRLSLAHDQLRLAKDKKFIPLVKILPGWLTPNQVTVFRTAVLLAWLPYAIFRPSLSQVLVFLLIYFLDLLDGAMARLTNRITRWGGYLDHSSDKLNNIAVLLVLYGVTGYQFNFFWFFIGWDIITAGWLAVEFYFARPAVAYARVPLELGVKTILWLFLAFKILPFLVQ